MTTLKPQSNGPLYSNTVICTLAVDGWAVGCYIWYSEEGPGRAAAPPSPIFAVLNVTAHPSTPLYQLHIIRCGTILAFVLLRVNMSPRSAHNVWVVVW